MPVSTGRPCTISADVRLNGVEAASDAGANRLVQEEYSSDNRTISCTLDACGNAVGVTDSALGAYTLTYDKANRLIGFEAPANLGGEMIVELDPAGSVTRLTLPDY